MGLEDLAMFRSIMGSTVFYPSDAVATERAVELAANTLGICFIRTGRPNCPVIYRADEQFAVGHGKVSPIGVHSKQRTTRNVIELLGSMQHWPVCRQFDFD